MQYRPILFYGMFFLLCGIAGLLITFLVPLLEQNLFITKIVFLQTIPLLWSYLVVGIGLGVLMFVLGGVLGWGQLLLLMEGKISPHLGQEGLINVITTLFDKL